ncbi:MAG TPA: DUF3574 domain-containing protein [Thermoanaerobaculia bacterium]|nr:DUF3574 domain-containing protein [Thermoanaerobaculia bacterium]
MRAVAVLTILLAACASVAPPVEDAVVADRLFCGLEIPGGGEIAQRELDTFIEEIVTPRFPQGFTVWRAKGQWRGGDEDTIVFEFVHPYDAAIDAKVKEIAEEYRRRFRQEAVLRVSTPARLEWVH